jgi:hypothetical protein
MPREVLRRRDSHGTSTKFRLGVIRWVHELPKRPSYYYSNQIKAVKINMARNTYVEMINSYARKT